MSEQRAMKEGLGPAAIKRIASAFSRASGTFAADEFRQRACHDLENLALKARLHHIIAALHSVLPKEFAESAPLLLAIKQHWDHGDDGDPLRGFAAWPVIDYVAAHGLGHPELALRLLRHLTPLFSAEFALRPFLMHHTKTTLAQLQQWLHDEDAHVRRLVSEGSRTRLPWGQRLPQFIHDPAPIITLLEALKDDPSDYVRRSVANNLNDLAKDHPDLVIATCRRWQAGASKERHWIIRHATRTLIKAGHPGSFELLGHSNAPQLAPPELRLERTTLAIGESLDFTVTLHSRAHAPQSIVLDYALHYMKASGRSSAKVFKLRNLNLAPGESVTLSHSRSFKPITTRRYYPGQHTLELLVNGAAVARSGFLLTA